MAKNSGDLILRDRMQFDIDAAGNRTTLYGRFDLSQFTDPVSRMGLAIKEVYFQFRNSADAKPSQLNNTGGFDPIGSTADSELDTRAACLKVYATSRAYENASEVGIASPDVLCVYERYSCASPAAFDAGVLDSGQAIITENLWYGPRDLHPSGYTVVSDLLIGIASDFWLSEADQTIELDVVLVAEPVKVTTERMNEILSQQQDL
ncbi:MAG: hypothetical protein [Circular genetic element sp.]|nr:MAG: hypothetical protein [Circular genetic element sp.]